MSDAPRYYLTTAIDYPNSRPHIGTAFEKIGADVQARYRRMQGFDVFFLMGTDENTVKVAKEAEKQGRGIQEYCDDMARQFREVWEALDVSYDTFIQTSHERHRQCVRKFLQKVYDAGHIYKSSYEGWYCDGCEAFKTEQDHKDDQGVCPIHKTPYVRRSEPCYLFRQSAFQDRLLKYIEDNPDFIQPETRRNEIVSYVKGGLLDVNISRFKQAWGIRLPFDEEFVSYVWFDALLTYVTGIGYGDDEATFNKYWPADVHFIGKDITRFHCALWPTMCFAAGIAPPKMVFGHGFVQVDNEKMSKTLGNVRDPLGIIAKFNVGVDAFRYYFMRECPFPGDGNYSDLRFAEVNDSELANKYGNLYSRIAKLVTTNYDRVLSGTAGKVPQPIDPSTDLAAVVREVQGHVEGCRYNQALQLIGQKILTPANQYADARAPWKLVKTDKEAAKQVLFDLTEPLRTASILLKPFLTRGPATIYRSFNFATPWERVRYEDAGRPQAPTEDLRFLAETDAKGSVKPLYPRIG